MLPISFLKGVRDCLPIAAGYFPVGLSFGISAIHAGLDPWMALAVSMVIYSGAAQFVLLSLLAAGGDSLWAIAGIVLLINTRHLFYGPVLSDRFPAAHRRLPVAFMAAALTDEVFAASLHKLDKLPADQREGWYAGLQWTGYATWVTGTGLGAYFAVDFAGESTLMMQAFGFVLPALFLALLLELAPLTRYRVLATAGAATALSLLYMPAYLAMIIGIVAAAALAGRRER